MPLEDAEPGDKGGNRHVRGEIWGDRVRGFVDRGDMGSERRGKEQKMGVSGCIHGA